MARHLAPFLLLLYLAVSSATLIPPNALSLVINSNVTHEIPSTLYGYMWEDINHSGDGGLYGELLQNRAFQAVIAGTKNALNGWIPTNGAILSVTSKTAGVSDALPNSLEVKIPSVVSGPIGFANTGFWGIKVQEGWKYTGSFYVKSTSFTGSITVSLKSLGGTTFASQTVTGVGSSWKKFTFAFTPKSSALNDNNVFDISLDGKEAAGKTLNFGLFTLFPPTFRGRANGMRIDLADALAGTGPSIWRFPGGNNLEGGSPATRWRWNETIGPLESRPGRVGDWGYANTDGLGLMEYLNWAEDLGAEPILGVWAGISIANYSDFTTWDIIPEADLQPYIDDVINEIEFITGDAKTTKWGKVRAGLGRTEPYQLKFVEIGNEDFFQADSYVAYRWAAFVNAISAKYPQLEFLATTLPSTALNPQYKRIDFHQYNSPSWFTTNAFMFDSQNYPRNGTKWFVGEYAVTSTNDTNALGTFAQGRLPYPTLEGAAAEAAFITGMERNSDVVFASAYAPSFQHIRSFQWTPDIITYDASRVVKSTSYYVQQMFSLNRGTHVLSTNPSSSPDFAPLFWVASWNNETGVVFLKVSNASPNDLTAYISFDFPVAQPLLYTVTSISVPALTVIPTSNLQNPTNPFSVFNDLDNPELIIPVENSFVMTVEGRFNYTFPATSVSVVALQTTGGITSE